MNKMELSCHELLLFVRRLAFFWPFGPFFQRQVNQLSWVQMHFISKAGTHNLRSFLAPYGLLDWNRAYLQKYQNSKKTHKVSLPVKRHWNMVFISDFFISSMNFIEAFSITSLFKVSYAKFQTFSNSKRPPLCNDLVNFSHYFHFKLRAKPTPFRHKMHILKKCAMLIMMAYS